MDAPSRERKITVSFPQVLVCYNSNRIVRDALSHKRVGRMTAQATPPAFGRRGYALAKHYPL